MPRKVAGVESPDGKAPSTTDDSYDNGKSSFMFDNSAFLVIMLVCFVLPVCVFFLYSPTAPGSELILRGSRTPSTAVRGHPQVDHPQAAGVHEPTSSSASASKAHESVHLDEGGAHESASSSVQASGPVQTRWRHPLQQDVGLPSGPERPAATPQDKAGSVSTIQCNTTAGPITIEVHQDWSPHGARRFLDMVRSGFFNTKVALFRAVRGFLCQTGIAGDPAVHKEWEQKGNIQDDPQWLDQSVDYRMKRGYLSFAGGGVDSRGTEFFFAFRDLALGSSPWEVPFATLIGHDSFQTMDHWYTGYGDMTDFGGKAPSQSKMYQEGLRYLQQDYPEIDYIIGCGLSERRPAMMLIPGYKTTYMKLKEGTGASVKTRSKVSLHATGVVQETGKKFWSTKDPNQDPFRFEAGLGQVIAGWDQGVLGMQKGEERKIIIPAEEAYGAAGFPAWGIPPEATLEFTIEVLDIW